MMTLIQVPAHPSVNPHNVRRRGGTGLVRHSSALEATDLSMLCRGTRARQSGAGATVDETTNGRKYSPA